MIMRCLIAALLVASVTPSFVGAEDQPPDFVFPGAADYPVVPKHVDSAEQAVPAKWQVMGKAVGDLNADKVNDVVLVLQGTSKKFIQKNDGLGSDPFDTNPRMLVILFGEPEGKGYRLVEQNNKFIPIPDVPTLMEPFDSVKISHGVLDLKFQVFYSAGGWGTDNTTYRFRYQNGKFALIGADKQEVQRNTGQTTLHSYNFLTNQMKVSSGTIDSDAASVSLKKLPRRPLKSLDDFKQLYNWQVSPDVFL